MSSTFTIIFMFTSTNQNIIFFLYERIFLCYNTSYNFILEGILDMEKAEVKVGISGGTFDPIHHGHLIVAEQIRESMGLDKIIFIPSGTPPHKDNKRITPAEHRYRMAELAIGTNPHFEISRIEVDRAGSTYTVDTLTELKALYGEQPGLYFITGADIIPELQTWRHFERLFTLCDFIAVLRPGYKKDGFLREIENLKTSYRAKIHIVDAPLIGISSTIIREQVKGGKSIKYLVPESVENYIHEKRLYMEYDY